MLQPEPGRIFRIHVLNELLHQFDMGRIVTGAVAEHDWRRGSFTGEQSVMHVCFGVE